MWLGFVDSYNEMSCFNDDCDAVGTSKLRIPYSLIANVNIEIFSTFDSLMSIGFLKNLFYMGMSALHQAQERSC